MLHTVLLFAFMMHLDMMQRQQYQYWSTDDTPETNKKYMRKCFFHIKSITIFEQKKLIFEKAHHLQAPFLLRVQFSFSYNLFALYEALEVLVLPGIFFTKRNSEVLGDEASILLDLPRLFSNLSSQKEQIAP